MNKRSLQILSGVIFLALSLDANAVQGVLQGSVLRTLVAADNRFGGCMALLDRPANSATNSPNCPPQGWVTFSCSGVFTSPDIAFRMLDQAQIAKASGRPVTVIIDDTRKHNGFCFANRIDLR